MTADLEELQCPRSRSVSPPQSSQPHDLSLHGGLALICIKKRSPTSGSGRKLLFPSVRAVIRHGDYFLTPQASRLTGRAQINLLLCAAPPSLQRRWRRQFLKTRPVSREMEKRKLNVSILLSNVSLKQWRTAAGLVEEKSGEHVIEEVRVVFAGSVTVRLEVGLTDERGDGLGTCGGRIVLWRCGGGALCFSGTYRRQPRPSPT